MRLSNERINSLRSLLKKITDKDYTIEQTHESGMAIMRFVVAKKQRKKEIMEGENYEYKITR